MIKYNINICDQIHDEVMVHFTQYCNNKCPFCIDAMNYGIKYNNKPNTDAILYTILTNSNKIKEVTISGGEPFLFIEELYELVKNIKTLCPHIYLGIISSIPQQCNDNIELFNKIIEVIDWLSISPQHHDEYIADKIRGHKSKFDRNYFYKCLADNFKDKTSININIMKPYLSDSIDLYKTIEKFYNYGFTKFRVAEMFDKDNMYISIEEMFPKLKLKSPFAHGCNTPISIKKLFPNCDFNLNINIKRSCFYKTKHQHASIADIFKLSTRWICAKDYSFGVIYEDGSLHPYWC